MVSRFMPFSGQDPRAPLPVRYVPERPPVRGLYAPMARNAAAGLPRMNLPLPTEGASQGARTLPNDPAGGMEMQLLGPEQSILAPPYVGPREGILGPQQPAGQKQDEGGTGLFGTGVNPLVAIGLALSAAGDLTSEDGSSLDSALASLQQMREQQMREQLFQAKMAQAQGNHLKEINGQLVDTRTMEVVGDYRDPEKPEKDMFTVKRGDMEYTVIGDPTDPTTWITAAEAPRYKPSSTTVNVGGTTETEFDKTFGKAMGEQAATIYSESDKATSQIGRLDRLEGLVTQWEASGGSLGPLATTQENAAAWAESLGIEPGSLGLPEDAGPAQAIRAIGNEMALGKIGGEDGMPANNFSDADRKFVTSTVPQITDTAEGLRLKVEVTRRGAERAREKERMWAEAEAEGKTYREFRREWADYVEKNPLFSTDEKESLKARTSSGAAKSFDGWTIEEVTE